ncbi:MAG TPA: periplasmic heavy metal sensor, partial [Bacteroidota bacterium]
MKPKQIFLTVFLVLFVSATAVAQRGPGGMDNPLRQELRQRLNLSDDQQNQIGKLRTEFQKQQVAQRSKLQTAQIELRELMRGDTPDKSAIEKKINELSQFQAQQRIA